MAKPTYDDPVLAAAATRAENDSPGAWRLADALAQQVPPGTRGGDHGNQYTGGKPGDVTLIATHLADYAERLAKEDIVAPHGGPYTASSLGDLRDVAIRWPKAERHNEAAFRTHQEASSPEKRAALAALCKRAAGLRAIRPSGLNPDAWEAARSRVDAAKKRGLRFPVTANALRAAVGGKVNTPPRDNDVAAHVAQMTPATQVEVARHVLRDREQAERVMEDTTTANTAFRAAADATIRRAGGTPGLKEEVTFEGELWAEAHRINSGLLEYARRYRKVMDRADAEQKERARALMQPGLDALLMSAAVVPDTIEGMMQ